MSLTLWIQGGGEGDGAESQLPVDFERGPSGHVVTEKIGLDSDK